MMVKIMNREILFRAKHIHAMDYKQFGHEETIIDWIAIQFPKMIKAFESVNAL